MFETFYKLSANPFRLTPDPKFCFRHASYNQAYAYLQYALRLGEGCIMVTGRPGIGKTTLAEVFLTEIEHSEVVAARVASANVEAADLLRVVAYSYGIDVAGLDKATVLLRLEQFFVRQTQAGRRVLLIIDEAQALPNAALEELRLLGDMQQNSRPLLQLFLVGQERLRRLMREPEMEQFQQRVIGACHLEPMDLRATRAYMEHRLRTAGWTGDPQLTGEAVLALYQYTKGVPRHVNKICTRLLLHGMLHESHELDKEDAFAVAAELRAEQLAPVDGNETAAAEGQETEAVPELASGELSLADLVLRMDPQEAEQLKAAAGRDKPEPAGAANRRAESRDGTVSGNDAVNNAEGCAPQRSPLGAGRVTERSSAERRGAQYSAAPEHRSGLGEFRRPPGRSNRQVRQAVPRGAVATQRRARGGQRNSAAARMTRASARPRPRAIVGQYLRERARMFGRLRWQGKLAVLAGALLLANLIAAFVVMGRDDGSVHQIFLVEYSEPTQESDKQDQRQDLIVRRESDKPSGTLIDDPQGPVVSGQDDVVPGQADGAAKQQPDRGEDERFAGLVESWDHNRRIGSARSRTPTPAASASGVAGQRSQRNEPEATVDESSVGQTASAAGPDERSERQAVPEGGVADSPVRQPARPAPETELAAVESLVVLDKMPARGEPIAAPPVEPPRAPAKVFSPSAPQKSEDNTGASEELETASPGGAAEGGRTEVAKVADSPGKAATVATPAARIHGQPVQGREGAAKPSVPKRQKIAKLLASGHRSLQRDRLLVPSDDSAYKYYQEALILDPDNDEARLGIERVVARYAVLARKALDNDDETKGELYVNRGLSINPTDERLLGLRDSLKAPVVQVEPLLQPPVVPVKKPPSARVDEKEPEPTGFFSRLKAFFTQGQPAKRNEVPVEER